jgi:tetratricopeptide (TPR) repeat protein
MLSRSMGDYDGAGVSFKKALDIMRETGELAGESQVLCEWALLLHQVGDDEYARDLCQQALLAIQDLGARHGLSLVDVRGFALTFLGHAMAGLGFLREASDAYSQALTLRRELDQPHLATEPLAGLARLSLAQGDSAQAQTHAEEILDLLASRKLDGTAEPFRVYLTCYQVLAGSGEHRAREILIRAHTELLEQAARIPDEAQRGSFLENVAENRELVRAWEAAQAGAMPDDERERRLSDDLYLRRLAPG